MGFESFNGGGDTAMLAFNVAAHTDRAAGDILIMDGRRYKVASVGSTPDGTAGKVSLTDIPATTFVSSRTVTTAIGEHWMAQGYTNINHAFSAKSANSPAATTITLNKGGKNGYPLDHPGVASSLTKNLYRVLNGMGYKPFEVTEAVGGTTYQYVSQCSNRGA